MNDQPALASAPDAPFKNEQLAQIIGDMGEVTRRLELLRDKVAGSRPSEVADALPIDNLANLLSNGSQVLLGIRGEQLGLIDELENLLL